MSWIIAHVFIAIVSVIMLGVSHYIRPGSINSFVGYRTRRSMKNEETWDEANRFSSKVLMVVAVSSLVSQLLSISLLGGFESFIAATIYLTLSSILVIPVTELHLRSVFNEDGSRKRSLRILDENGCVRMPYYFLTTHQNNPM